MRVVKLDGGLLGKRVPIVIAAAEAPHEIGQRTRYEKIFLYETQFLPAVGGVVGVEPARNGLGHQGLSHGSNEIAVAENLKIEVIRRTGGPQTEGVDVFSAIADHGPIKRHPDQR